MAAPYECDADPEGTQRIVEPHALRFCIARMRALQYRTIAGGPELVEVPTPEPGPGHIRLRVTAPGLCHSDWFVLDLPADKYAYGLPLTLGHEGAGVVDALGDGVTGVALGDAVAVYGPWGCGLCSACARGAEN